MKFEVKNEPLSIFSFSSLTDIVMLLVIFFLLTSQFVITTGVKVKLPGSKVNEQAAPSQMVVTLTSTGGVYVGQDEVGLNDLPARLEQLKKGEEDNLIIRADKAVAVDLVIKVIDAAKATGIEKFTIETEKQQL